MITLDKPRLIQSCRPLSNASNSAKLLEVADKGEASLAIHLPESSLTMQPIRVTPIFPLVAPSKFSLYHLHGGGAHLQLALASLLLDL